MSRAIVCCTWARPQVPVSVLGSVWSSENTTQGGEGTQWDQSIPKRECFGGREIAVRACESSLVDVRTSTPHVLTAATSTCCKLFVMTAESVHTRLLDHCPGIFGWTCYPTGDANGTCVAFIWAIEN